jgi:hypothetical protein
MWVFPGNTSFLSADGWGKHRWMIRNLIYAVDQ